MKNKYRFAFRKDGGLWGLEETARITQRDWEKFTVSMTDMVAALRDFGEDIDFKELGSTKGCIFDK